MTDETIQKDVSAEAKAENAETAQPSQGAEQEDDKPVVGFDQPANRRERKMAEIAEKAKEQRESDRKKMALINDPDLTEEAYDSRRAAQEEADRAASGAADDESGEDGDEQEVRAEEREEGEQEQEREEQPRHIPAGFVDRGDGTPVKRLKVNGRTVELTVEEYDRQLSKDLAGDQKLRLAAERERQLQERMNALEERERRAKEKPPEAPGANSEEIDRLSAEYHDAVYAGDADAAKAKLQELLRAGRQSSTPNMDDFIAEASTRIKQEAEAERHRASVQDGWQTLQREFPEVAASRRHLAYADEVVKEIVNDPENAGLSPREIILKAAEETARAFNLRPQEKDQGASSTDAVREREARKAQLKPIPSAGNRTKPSDKKPQVDMSSAAKIARMRQSRAL